MPRLIRSALAALLTLLVLPLLLLFASGSTQVAIAALPSTLGIDSADDEDYDDGGEEEDYEDEGEDMDDADDSEDMDESDEMDESEEYDESEEITSEESAEYSEEYAYFESSESFEAEEYAEWSYSVELTSVSSSQYGYSFSAPSGGAHPGAASLGFDAGDGVEFPFVWVNNGSDELLFNKIVLAVYDNGAPIAAQTFTEIAAAEDEELHATFPEDLVAPEHHMLGSHKWVYSAYGGSADNEEIDVFSTMDGDKYYSFYFIGTDPGSHAQQSWDQMAAIVSSFK